MVDIAVERPEDAEEVEALYDLAFAPGRGALSSYQLRAGVAPIDALCLVIRDGFDVVVGAIRYWPIAIGAARDPALLLGPVAVHPTRQGEGLGAVLIAESLARARALGWRRVVLVGDEPYYRRFGFTRAAGLALRFPEPVNPNRVLALAASPDAASGLVGEVRPWR